jgi:DNA topoisomerase-1
LEECRTLIAAAPERRGRRGAKKTASKAAKKATKKATTKKSKKTAKKRTKKKPARLQGRRTDPAVTAESAAGDDGPGESHG